MKEYFPEIDATRYSNASGTLLLDVVHKCWSGEMCGLSAWSRDVPALSDEGAQPPQRYRHPGSKSKKPFIVRR